MNWQQVNDRKVPISIESTYDKVNLSELFTGEQTLQVSNFKPNLAGDLDTYYCSLHNQVMPISRFSKCHENLELLIDKSAVELVVEGNYFIEITNISTRQIYRTPINLAI